jgi:DNA-binding CsgD family transcriptional regulator
MIKGLDKNILERLYVKEHKSTPEIAKMFGCTHRTVQLRCRKSGIKLRPKGAKLEHINKPILHKLYIEENKSVREISEILSCSTSVIKNRCKEYGIRLTGNRKTGLLEKKLLEELYVEEQKSLRNIAQIIGCSREAVRTSCKKHRIPLRTSRTNSYSSSRTAINL